MPICAYFLAFFLFSLQRIGNSFIFFAREVNSFVNKEISFSKKYSCVCPAKLFFSLIILFFYCYTGGSAPYGPPFSLRLGLLCVACWAGGYVYACGRLASSCAGCAGCSLWVLVPGNLARGEQPPPWTPLLSWYWGALPPRPPAGLLLTLIPGAPHPWGSRQVSKLTYLDVTGGIRGLGPPKLDSEIHFWHRGP